MLVNYKKFKKKLKEHSLNYQLKVYLINFTNFSAYICVMIVMNLCKNTNLKFKIYKLCLFLLSVTYSVLLYSIRVYTLIFLLLKIFKKKEVFYQYYYLLY